MITPRSKLTAIDANAFSGYQALTSLTIPDSVTSIGNYAFSCCNDLKIYGAKGSYAEKYAKRYDIPFEEYGDEGDLVKLSDCTISVSDKVCTGKKLKPAVTVTYGDKTLKKGKDYTVTYGKNKAIGIGTVKVVGKGGYTGVMIKSFSINPKKVSGLTLKAGKGKIKACWKKAAAGVTGYELEYASDNSFIDAITVTLKKAGTVKRTLSGLESGKTNYVRIRAFKNVGDVTCYSAWSSAKKAKVK